MKYDIYFTDMLSEDLHLPDQKINHKDFWGDINYIIESEDGFFSSNIQCLFQIKTLIGPGSGIRITGGIDNFGIFNPEGCGVITPALFNDFVYVFNLNLPSEILNRFPNLYRMAKCIDNPYEPINDMIDLKFGHEGYDNSGKIYRFQFTTKPLKGNVLNSTHLLHLGLVAEFVGKAVKEYQEYKKTRLYKMISQNVSKIKNKVELGTSIFMLYKLAKVAFSLYNGSSLGDDNTSNINFDLDSSSFDNLSNENMADYLCQTDFDITDSHSDISFTGSDKYTDNDYNQEGADNLLEQEEYLRKKGDNTGADAAHSQAKKHLDRIK